MPAGPARATTPNTPDDDDRRLLAPGLAALDAGQVEQALAEAELLLASAPSHGAGLVLLGFVGLLRNQPALALEALLAAHEEQPASALIAEALAILYALGGELAEATYFAKLSQANGLDAATTASFPKAWPGFAGALLAIRERPYYHKGMIALETHRPALAADFFEAQLAFRPNDGQAIRALADCRLALDQPRRAAELLDRFAVAHADARDLSCLSHCLAQCGLSERAATLADEAGRRAPHDLEIATAAIAAASFDPAATAPRLRDLARVRYDGVPPLAAVAARAPLPAGGLRLGLLLGRPWDGEALAAIGTLAQGCRSLDDVTVVAFGEGPLDQACYASLHGRIDHWIDISRFDPTTLAVVIRGEGIDVMLDTGGLAASLSCATLSHHPAPLVIAWLGQPVAVPPPGTDLILSAPGLDPDIPNAALALCPAGLVAPVAGPATGRRPDDGAILLGADLRLGQIHDDLLDCWAVILAAIPNGRLVLRDRELSHPDNVAELIGRAGSRGIAERVELMTGSRAAFAAGIDLMLAPFVAADGFDALAALAAGRPAVACAGDGRHRRFAASALICAGLDSWVASSPADYAATAIRLAGDLDAAGVRARAAATAIPADHFARAMVAAIRKGAAQ